MSEDASIMNHYIEYFVTEQFGTLLKAERHLHEEIGIWIAGRCVARRRRIQGHFPAGFI